VIIMVVHKEENRKKTAPPPVFTGLVFELEKLAVPGQRLLFEACQKVLKDKQVALSPVLWSRFGLAAPLAQGLGRLLTALDKKSMAADKLAHAIQEVFFREIARPAVKLNTALNTLLTETAKLNMKCGALSFLPDEQARALLVRLGLQERVCLRVMQKDAVNVPTPDCWLMTCKTIGVPARRCVAVVESAAACNAALEAGLRCVVVPDEFTAYQDFGGADRVIEDLKDLHAGDLQALLHACAFR
jgi:beta-phosphoglucomutase-like phosphatase (HAD superfamily)